MSKRVSVNDIEIVGHRGAAGLAPENTILSIKTALKNNVDGVEFDVRLTSDDELVLCHDGDLEATTGEKTKIKELSLSQIQDLKTLSGQPIPTLEEVLKLLIGTVAIIELKDGNSVNPLLKVIDKFPNSKIRVTSFKHGEIALLKERRPNLFVYAAENTKPFEVIHSAHFAGADGITLNVWLLNPLTYFFTKRRNLEIMVYTVNFRFVAWFIHVIYPGVSMCTNLPDKIHHHKR